MKLYLTQKAVTAAIAVATLSVAASASASAAPGAENSDFGRHVATCARDMDGFSGAHNPSMHRSPAGWTDSECSEHA